MSESELREKIVKAQEKYLTVREDRYWSNTQKTWVYTNRGTELDKIQKRAGCPLGCYWCGAYQTVLHQDVGIDVRKDFGIENPLSVREWFKKSSRIVYIKGSGNQRTGILPKKGDEMRMFYSHIEMYVGDDWLKDFARKKIPSGGGNTGGGKGWHGVYITNRNLNEIQLVSNHISFYYNKQKKL
ncbi:hypothetical protein SAMN04515674_101519 [Pseudarcicella hirudinis]|uniref:Uncharacterized protein n=1 Tax=Pseudarcicella hirudinis TaxID=1079859 RepID=A0A1I5MYZ0_9BACT|nr:hypothetical protein [Pseudarcicella hirudinis]SFP14784.1 hypothetical protein SAMN04515674_101519 [Pseudarcicella hirudinis]